MSAGILTRYFSCTLVAKIFFCLSGSWQKSQWLPSAELKCFLRCSATFFTSTLPKSPDLTSFWFHKVELSRKNESILIFDIFNTLSLTYNQTNSFGAKFLFSNNWMPCHGGWVFRALALQSSKTAILLRPRFQSCLGLQNQLHEIRHNFTLFK